LNYVGYGEKKVEIPETSVNTNTPECLNTEEFFKVA
jgi:hypothetical protein